MSQEKLRGRLIYVGIIIIAIVIVSRLITLQIVQGQDYLEMSQNRLVKTMPIKAPRGEIFDRYGRPLVTNRLGFSVVFQREYIESDKLNALILRVIEVIESTDGSYFDTLAISAEPPYEFLPGRTMDYKSADAAMIELREKYKIDGTLADRDIRRIAGVRYEMEQRGFSVTTPYTFATDVSMVAVTKIKEQRAEFAGVLIMTEPIREYVNGTILAHVLGHVGPIYSEEYEELESKGYKMNDVVGKDGIEKVMEDELKGIDGVLSIQQSVSGQMASSQETIPATSGNYVVLTIDSELQKVLEKSLEENIERAKQHPDSRDASVGAAVVIDVNSGEILAMASYPTFDLSKFNENFNQLNADPLQPMFNRAISGAYAPGSTFKVLTAIAGLEEGIITPQTSILDEGKYKFYPDYQPACWLWNSAGATHGYENVTEAIRDSCNYFFYDVGRRLTIENLKKYGDLFGLGQRTGIEISGEASGIFASPEYREKNGSYWVLGDTLQAAIGQSDHMFTPLQLANYTATVANGGTRYKTHIIKSVKSYTSAVDGVNVVPEVVADIDIQPQNYNAVMAGMKAVSETGTAANVFSSYGMEVGSKTGTASVPKGSDNGIFIAFAPYESAQIAVAVVVEHGGHGNTIAPIARDVFNAYMEIRWVEDEIPVSGGLVR